MEKKRTIPSLLRSSIFVCPLYILYTFYLYAEETMFENSYNHTKTFCMFIVTYKVQNLKGFVTLYDM